MDGWMDGLMGGFSQHFFFHFGIHGFFKNYNDEWMNGLCSQTFFSVWNS
jgi:uncharacterized membrane protein